MTADWVAQTLSEACEIKPPKSEVKRRLSDNDSVSFVPMEDLGVDRKFVVGNQSRELSSVIGSYTYFADGDVLLAKITPCFENGKLGIAHDLENGVGFGSSEYIVFRPGVRLDAQWLYYFLSRDSFRAEGVARMGGAVGHKRVAKEFIESYPISLPPLAEQHRIVAILDEAFAGIATVKANAENSLRNARDLCNCASQKILDSVGGVKMSLESVAAGDCTLSYGIVQPGDDVENGLPVVRPVDLTREVIALDGLKRIDPKLATSYHRTRLQGGELLLCVRGTTGTVSVASPELEGANVTRGIVPIRFKPGLVAASFGYHLMKSGGVQSQIREKTYGTALMQINISDLRNVSVKIPSLTKQRELAERLDSLRQEGVRLQSLYARKLAALAELKQSLLQQAFSGQL